MILELIGLVFDVSSIARNSEGLGKGMTAKHFWKLSALWTALVMGTVGLTILVYWLVNR